MEDFAGFGGYQVAEGVGGVVAAEAIFVGVDFQDVFGTVGVVLEVGEAIQETSATLVNENFGWDVSVRIAEALEDFGPAIDAIGVGGT